MSQCNPHLEKLKAGYIFPEISKRVARYEEGSPKFSPIRLGIGDTTEPLPPLIANAMADYARGMATPEGYHGYGPFQGELELRKKIAETLYTGNVSPDEVFISDGAKCDIGRLHLLFDPSTRVALQDPSYPPYADTSVICGHTGTNGYEDLIRLPCTPENNFFPDLSPVKDCDLLYFCSPNNPTGSAATRDQLQELVSFAKSNNIVILYDSAYAFYIQDDTIPRSIFEIEGAREVAIEVGSFSKMAGFTGIRLGWSIVPKELRYKEGTSIHGAWSRIIATFFNGACSIAQAGGMAALTPEGIQEMKKLSSHYMENAQAIKNALKNFQTYGGEHAPYIWAHLPGKDSWESFDTLLKETGIVTTPGSAFGSSGDQFLRFSAFGKRENIQEACKRLTEWPLNQKENQELRL